MKRGETGEIVVIEAGRLGGDLVKDGFQFFRVFDGLGFAVTLFLILRADFADALLNLLFRQSSLNAEIAGFLNVLL